MAALENRRHERFCREYVGGRNGALAAEAAGFSPRGARARACEILKRPDVQKRIAELDTKLLKKADITAERVMMELGRLAFADVRGLYDDDGNLRGVHELDDDVAATVAGIEVDVTKGRDGAPDTQTVKVKRYEKAAALRVLAQHFKIVGNDLDQAAEAAVAVAEKMARARERLKEMRKKAR